MPTLGAQRGHRGHRKALLAFYYASSTWQESKSPSPGQSCHRSLQSRILFHSGVWRRYDVDDDSSDVVVKTKCSAEHENVLWPHDPRPSGTGATSWVPEQSVEHRIPNGSLASGQMVMDLKLICGRVFFS